MYRVRGLGPPQKKEKPETVKGLQIAPVNYPLLDKALFLCYMSSLILEATCNADS
jgi:hypothetical protein